MKKKSSRKAKGKSIATQIRLPEDVYRALRKAGSRNGRSMNSELSFRLRQSLALDEEPVDGPPKDEREAL